MEPNDFNSPNESRVVDKNWFVHQLNTTCNFAMNSKLLSWFIGGLNFQIEHHLFPNICHIHYKKISKIVQSTAQEFNVPYKSYKNMFSAVRSHYKFLKHLGSYKLA
jgi:linoleoyl-CoA desaturase